MLSSLSLSVEQLRVIVRIDGADVSRVDGNVGPDPWLVLVPVNRFLATGGFTTATVACCRCGPDCFAVGARIRREREVVRWQWWSQRGTRWADEQRVTLFDGETYNAEVARFAADRAWEIAVRRAGRLILTDLALPTGVDGISVRADGTDELEVWLEEPDRYQIFVRVPWDEQRPDESVATARAILTGPTARWPAQWHRVEWPHDVPPAYAGPSWRRADWSP